MMQNNDRSLLSQLAEFERRNEILGKLRLAQGEQAVGLTDQPAWRTPARDAGNAQQELEKLLAEINLLGGNTCQLSKAGDLSSAFQNLVNTHNIKRATCWETSQLADLMVEAILKDLGVELVSPRADKYHLAECDLGVTGADCALPETGTLFLRSSIEQPFVVSLLPRIHLVLLDPRVLRLDIAQAFEEFMGQRFICITGPSRTADIELTLSVGVHGPKILDVWALTYQV